MPLITYCFNEIFYLMRDTIAQFLVQHAQEIVHIEEIGEKMDKGTLVTMPSYADFNNPKK